MTDHAVIYYNGIDQGLLGTKIVFYLAAGVHLDHIFPPRMINFIGIDSLSYIVLHKRCMEW